MSMNTELFQQAKEAYQGKDFMSALQAYTVCLQDTENIPDPGEVGLLYHQIGNCLVRCKNYSEAIQAYSQATNDEAYDALGNVHFNLGQAYATLRDYDNAVMQFKAAVDDAKYPTRYKAYAAMGTALLKVGKSAEAGVAFREAALDEANPDPTKSLLNLGICFMALDRPADAIATYESALPFTMPADTRNRLMANLGQAYVATGQMKKAVGAFEQAIEDKTYFLSDSAAVDYQRAVGAVSQGTETFTQVPVDLAAQAEAQNNFTDTSGLDTLATDGTAVLDPVVYDQLQQDYGYGYDQDVVYADGSGQPLPKGEEGFLAPTDRDMDEWQRNFEMAGKKKKHTGLKVLLGLLLVLVLVAAGGVFAYTQGLGYPSQDTVVKQLFSDPKNASDVFASEISNTKIQSLVDGMPTDANVSIDGTDNGMNESIVYATAKTAEGGSVTYEVVLSRDGIGWKVVDVQMYFASQH